MATITTVTVFLLLLLTFASLLSDSAPPPQPPGCAAELVAFSPCLSYVSAPPNNLTETVTSQCCEAVSSAFETGDGDCLCYLLRQPLIFGFPLNETRLLSLPRVCNTSGSLKSICSQGSPALPPLRGTTGSQNPKPSDSGHVNGSAPSKSLPQESARTSPTNSSLDTTRCPFPTKQILEANSWLCSSVDTVGYPFPTKQIFEASGWFLPGILISHVFIHM